MSPGERERIIERLVERLGDEAVHFERVPESDGCQVCAAVRRQEIRALEDMRPFWIGGPDHLVGKQNYDQPSPARHGCTRTATRDVN